MHGRTASHSWSTVVLKSHGGHSVLEGENKTLDYSNGKIIKHKRDPRLSLFENGSCEWLHNLSSECFCGVSFQLPCGRLCTRLVVFVFHCICSSVSLHCVCPRASCSSSVVIASVYVVLYWCLPLLMFRPLWHYYGVEVLCSARPWWQLWHIAVRFRDLYNVLQECRLIAKNGRCIKRGKGKWHVAVGCLFD